MKELKDLLFIFYYMLKFVFFCYIIFFIYITIHDINMFLHNCILPQDGVCFKGIYFYFPRYFANSFEFTWFCPDPVPFTVDELIQKNKYLSWFLGISWVLESPIYPFIKDFIILYNFANGFVIAGINAKYLMFTTHYLLFPVSQDYLQFILFLLQDVGNTGFPIFFELRPGVYYVLTDGNFLGNRDICVHLFNNFKATNVIIQNADSQYLLQYVTSGIKELDLQKFFLNYIYENKDLFATAKTSKPFLFFWHRSV